MQDSPQTLVQMLLLAICVPQVAARGHAWFAVFEIARRRRDFELATKAQGELKRLGITVKYRRGES